MSLTMMRVSYFRSSSCVVKQLRHTGSSQPSPIQSVNILLSGVVEKDSSKEKIEKIKQSQNSQTTLTSAVFKNLKGLANPIDVDDAINKMMKEAKTVEELLSIVSQKKITRNHALKLVSMLADWTVEGRAQTADFEKDSRFLIACRVLGSNPIKGQGVALEDKKSQDSTDLMTVLGVASDGEAAKLISNINLSQMIKVLSTLASKKRRSILLLRSLAFNISGSQEKLDIKQGADALYAVASLTYHDEMLLEKVCGDLCSCIAENKKRAVIGSIITSLGLQRHKHVELLNLLCEWVETNISICNTDDLVSLLFTLGTLNHLPLNQETLIPLLVSQLEANGAPNSYQWLDVVWSLAVLKKETAEQIASVLSPEFLEKITTVSTEGLSVSRKYKLLNLNGVARLRTENYKGPLLDLSSEEWKVPLIHNKNKQTLVTAMQEAMLNLLPSTSYINTNVDTDMGFIIDAECVLTTQMKPLPLFDKKTKQPIDRSGPDMQKGIKVAIMVNDFFDVTRGRRELTGANSLHQELLRLKGYRVMNVDHLDFNLSNKLVVNVQYLNQQLKQTMGKS